MAVTVTELNTVTRKHFLKDLTSQVYDSTPFLAKLKADNQIKASGGQSLQWPIRYQELGSAGATTAREQVTFESKETRTGVTADWAYVDAVTMMHWDERATNQGPEQIVNLSKDKQDELLEDFQDYLATTIFGTTTTGIAPLTQMIDATDTYGGMAYDAFSGWASTISTDTTLTISKLDEARNAATFGKNGPTLHVTTRDLYSKYESLLEGKEVLVDVQMADLGFDSIKYHNVPIVADPYCTAEYWYGIDMKQFKLMVLKGQDPKPTDWFTLEQAGFPNAVAKYMSGVMQLICKMRKTSFKFEALDYEL